MQNKQVLRDREESSGSLLFNQQQRRRRRSIIVCGASVAFAFIIPIYSSTITKFIPAIIIIIISIGGKRINSQVQY